MVWRDGQLPHVAGPAITAQDLQQIRGNAHGAVGHQALQLARQQVVQVRALTQCGPLQRQAIEPVVQIFTETAGLHFSGQMAVGGAHQCKIHRHRLAAAQRHHFAVLQHAQEPGLQGQRHVANFIEEQRAAVRFADASRRPFAPGSGKGTALITKQLGLDQVFRQGRAVDGHKRLGAARPAVVHGTRKQLFAHAGLALQQQAQSACPWPCGLARWRPAAPHRPCPARPVRRPLQA